MLGLLCTIPCEPMPRKRRRPDDADEDLADTWDDAPLSEQATDLLVDWAWGKIPAVQVQKRLHGSLKDGATHPEVAALAKLGAWGRHPQHVHRDLVRRFFKDMCMPAPQSVVVLAINPRHANRCHPTVDMILPHDWFSHLFHHYRDEFWRLFAVPEITRFWSGASRFLGRKGGFVVHTVITPTYDQPPRAHTRRYTIMWLMWSYLHTHTGVSIHISTRAFAYVYINSGISS